MGLVVKTFIEGIYGGNKWLKDHCSEESFWRLYRGVVEGLFRYPGVSAWILALHDDPDTVIGYLVYSQVAAGRVPVMHWIYVKKDFRGYGLAKKLIEQAGFAIDKAAYYTHTTDRIKTQHPDGWALQPYLFF